MKRLDGDQGTAPRWGRAFVVWGSLLAFAGCGEDAGGLKLLVPELIGLDSVLLQEPDSLPFGRQVEVARDSRGRTYLSDVAGRRIYRFGPAGRLEAVLGHLGGGPGEFRSVSMVHLLPGDSLGVVIDGAAGALTVLHLERAEVVARHAVPFRGTGKQWHARGPGFYFSLPLSPRLIGHWRPDSGTAQTFGPLPADLAAAFGTYAQYGVPELVPVDDGFVAQIPGLRGVQVLDSTGAVRSEVLVPAPLRRGEPEGLIALHGADGPITDFKGSLAGTLARLSTGEFVSLRADLSRTAPPEGRGTIEVRYFASVLSADLTSACAEVTVPFNSDSPYPVPHFVGDTLVVLTRRVVGDSAVRNTLLRYRISAAGCRFVPTERVNWPSAH